MNHPAADGPRAEGADGLPTPESRRAFFRKTALAAAPAALLAAAGTASAQGTGTGSGIAIPDLYPGWSARNFNEIREDEDAHVAYLTKALGSNALPAPALNTSALTIPTANPILFAAYASVFENTGAMTYNAAGPLIYDKGTFAAAASIYGVECYHSGFINTLIDFPLTPNNAIVVPRFTIQQTLANISPYLVDPSGTVALANSISTTPSAANDLKILNFALVLERLEQAFYTINVPRFFG